jgi:hypothetical protein
VSGVFGEPTDLDGNGRVILFFTRGVNEKAPAGGTGFVAGYFWAGDLFPAEPGGNIEACPSSNEGEILYLAIPTSLVGAPVSLERLVRITSTTAGHELQHLLNTGRRIYANGAQRGEETWLNEGLSVIAEELLFYASTGLSPGANLDADQLGGDPAIEDAFERFAQENIGRFNLHIQIARLSSPLGRDGFETRGASWAFLRYAADRDPGLFSSAVWGTRRPSGWRTSERFWVSTPWTGWPTGASPSSPTTSCRRRTSGINSRVGICDRSSLRFDHSTIGFRFRSSDCTARTPTSFAFSPRAPRPTRCSGFPATGPT